MVKTYTEVYEILNLLGNEYIKKLPIELYNHIDNNRDKKSIIEYDINKNILDQNISEDARDMIAYLNLQYWCTEEEREELMKKYQKNEIRYQEELKEKYNPDNLFNNKKTKNIDNDNENAQIIVYRENIFTKIVNKIKRFLKIK